jgi:hypothetical protein
MKFVSNISIIALTSFYIGSVCLCSHSGVYFLTLSGNRRANVFSLKVSQKIAPDPLISLFCVVSSF